MPGKLDEISVAIGAQGAEISGLKQSFDRHCDDDDRRHRENLQVLKAIEQKLGALNDVLQPVVASVTFMRPIVDGYVLTRSKLAAWASIGLGVIALLGWAVEALVKWAVSAALSHFH